MPFSAGMCASAAEDVLCTVRLSCTYKHTSLRHAAQVEISTSRHRSCYHPGNCIEHSLVSKLSIWCASQRAKTRKVRHLRHRKSQLCRHATFAFTASPQQEKQL